MTFPFDFDGFGELYEERIYENLKFYDPKISENRNNSFM